MSTIQMTIGDNNPRTCNLEEGKTYYVSFAANVLLTDQPTCKVNKCNVSVIASPLN